MTTDVIEKRDQIEERDGFDRTLAEDAINQYLTEKIGGPQGFLDSSAPGVLAMYRISSYDDGKFSWNELACQVARETGYTMLAAANCDWETDDGPDEEATWLSFDIPGVDPGYKDAPYRDLIDGPIKPDTATAEDFEAFFKARKFAKGRMSELKAKLEYAEDFEKDVIQLEIDQLDILMPSLLAWDRDAVVALNARDVATAHAAWTAANTPETAAAPAI